MSSVFLSFDVAKNIPVVVKVLADHLAHSREFVGRFYREARLSRLLDHPNLVRGLAAGFDPAAGKHYLILEFIDGSSGHTILSRLGRFPIGVAVQVGIDIGRALEFLHSRRYVHRDIKPDNILFHPDGIAKLADLGLTKRLNDDPQITATNQGVGTSYYMAYEQALNANLVDGRSDIFALGATLYHFLTGEVPFPGATHEEVIREKAQNVCRPARELNPEIPAALAEILAATLARDPRARIQSASELVAALESTRLATRIPSFGPPESGSGQATGPESPTRTDFKIANQTGPGGSVPPTASYSLVPALGVASSEPRRAPVLRTRTRIVIGMLTAIALAGLAAGAVLGARTALAPRPPSTNRTVTHEVLEYPLTSDGLSPIARQ